MAFHKLDHIEMYTNVYFLYNFHCGLNLDPKKQVKDKDFSNFFFISNVPTGMTPDDVCKPFLEYGDPKYYFISDHSGYIKLNRGYNQLSLRIEECKKNVTNAKMVLPFGVLPWKDAKEFGILKTTIYSGFEIDQKRKRKKELERVSYLRRKRARKNSCTIL